jgi:hypothetical protein
LDLLVANRDREADLTRHGRTAHDGPLQPELLDHCRDHIDVHVLGERVFAGERVGRGERAPVCGKVEGVHAELSLGALVVHGTFSRRKRSISQGDRERENDERRALTVELTSIRTSSVKEQDLLSTRAGLLVVDLAAPLPPRHVDLDVSSHDRVFLVVNVCSARRGNTDTLVGGLASSLENAAI